MMCTIGGRGGLIKKFGITCLVFRGIKVMSSVHLKGHRICAGGGGARRYCVFSKKTICAVKKNPFHVLSKITHTNIMCPIKIYFVPVLKKTTYDDRNNSACSKIILYIQKLTFKLSSFFLKSYSTHMLSFYMCI